MTLAKRIERFLDTPRRRDQSETTPEHLFKDPGDGPPWSKLSQQTQDEAAGRSYVTGPVLFNINYCPNKKYICYESHVSTKAIDETTSAFK
jgi:hypothetical protein